MIYTCTVNPSIDYVIYVNPFEYGGLNRGEKPAYYPGGKGINVSRILKRLDIANTALGFIGGFTGHFIEQALLNEGIKTDFIKIDQETRINLKLKTTKETEINGPGPTITDENLALLVKQIKTIPKESTLVLAGSLPSSIPDNFYATIAEQCAQQNIRVVADTSSASLKALIGIPLFLIKPNHHELGELFGVKIQSTKDAIYYGRKLQKQGITHVIISMGGAGAIYLNDQMTLTANVPKGQVQNTVGAGDSTVAGFLAGLVTGLSNKEAFRYAIASGSATAFNSDLAEKKDLEALIPLIDISQS
ncbi:1-phosphofructokinase [Amphibacillus sediminis]|uniref:1-phosphofructokinase n=1 Tax=Amphibacillus sediminis TaxID=360185 RepID=UPI000835E759|nr:1-phosphofructokinase [Amphibacillus sediminis]